MTKKQRIRLVVEWLEEFTEVIGQFNESCGVGAVAQCVSVWCFIVTGERVAVTKDNVVDACNLLGMKMKCLEDSIVLPLSTETWDEFVYARRLKKMKRARRTGPMLSPGSMDALSHKPAIALGSGIVGSMVRWRQRG